MHVIVELMQHADVQLIDSMVELDEMVDGEHILVDEVDDEVVDDEDSVTVETDEDDELIVMITDIMVEDDETVEMLVIGELVEIDEIGVHNEHIISDDIDEIDMSDEIEHLDEMVVVE